MSSLMRPDICHGLRRNSKKAVRRAALGAALLTGTALADAAPVLQPAEQIRLEGQVRDARQISAVAIGGPWALLGGDEGRGVQPFRRLAPDRFRAEKPIPLVPSGGELDVEGIACQGDLWYVLGSHALVRKKLDDDKKQDANRRQLLEIEHEPSRDRLFRFRLSAGGAAEEVRSINLRPLLSSDPVIGPFCRIPSKENGLDLEGLAVAGDELFVGMRGPVLRANLAPVMRLGFDNPRGYDLRFVPLDGFGIRELARVSTGFLVIAGPVGDAPLPCRLYHWDGRDALPGKDAPREPVTLLGEFPARAQGKAEGLAILSETAADYTLLVVFDGIKGGRPTLFRVAKPGARE
jgi:hypothetical protein